MAELLAVASAPLPRAEAWIQAATPGVLADTCEDCAEATNRSVVTPLPSVPWRQQPFSWDPVLRGPPRHRGRAGGSRAAATARTSIAPANATADTSDVPLPCSNGHAGSIWRRVPSGAAPTHRRVPSGAAPTHRAFHRKRRAIQLATQCKQETGSCGWCGELVSSGHAHVCRLRQAEVPGQRARAPSSERQRLGTPRALSSTPRYLGQPGVIRSLPATPRRSPLPTMPRRSLGTRGLSMPSCSGFSGGTIGGSGIGAPAPRSFVSAGYASSSRCLTRSPSQRSDSAMSIESVVTEDLGSLVGMAKTDARKAVVIVAAEKIAPADAEVGGADDAQLHSRSAALSRPPTPPCAVPLAPAPPFGALTAVRPPASVVLATPRRGVLPRLPTGGGTHGATVPALARRPTPPLGPPPTQRRTPSCSSPTRWSAAPGVTGVASPRQQQSAPGADAPVVGPTSADLNEVTDVVFNLRAEVEVERRRFIAERMSQKADSAFCVSSCDGKAKPRVVGSTTSAVALGNDVGCTAHPEVPTFQELRMQVQLERDAFIKSRCAASLDGAHCGRGVE
eukprot:TRINITY_DN12097_c0_g1_i2.p1 TRINITY_DN12097_c0_g1~~TRINITY_DN12097_c0_g1_i2.p1  ORF type:complete len:594 (-),score=84.65 TRINITY_DN12097_c0_g1_i2:196-1884(-)